MSAARPPEGANAPSGGQRSKRRDKRGGNMLSAARPPEGANAPLGGSAVHEVTSVGVT